ncbi:glycosyltransferase family 4 protein [Microbacterium natoriense]
MTLALLHLGRTAAGPLLTLELARALINAGETIVVVYSSDAEIAPDLAALPCPTLAVSTFTSAAGALARLPRVPAIGKQINQFLTSHGADVVIITMEQVWQALIARSLRKARRVLLFVHDAEPHPGEDGFVRRSLTALQRRNADGAVVLSKHVEELLVAQKIFEHDRLWRTVHPAFDAPSTPVRTLNRQPLVIGFFGRMSKYKGLDLGVKTVAVLRERGYEIDFRIVGQGIPLDTPGISHVSNTLDDRWISQDDVVRTISTFDILLLPYVEASQSGVLAYAMALGIPSVVTPVGGLIEQALETRAAVIAESVTAASLADSIEALILSPRDYEQLSRNALSSAANEFSWSRTAHDIVDAAHDLLLKNRRKE